MKQIILLSICAALFVFSNCSTAANQNSNSQNAPENKKIAAANDISPIPPTIQPPVKTAEEIARISQQAFNSAVPRNSQTKQNQVQTNSNSSLSSRAAPDNSTFSSTMNDKGQPVEVRVFNNNPQLVKVERIYISPEQKILKVYLKNGKTVELKDEQVPNFPAASISAILNAVAAETKK